MTNTPIYMDNHATTRVDPRVLEAMIPMFDAVYGNAGSTSHVFGWEARDAVAAARGAIAAAIHAEPREIVFTSGATESNNLAIRGVVDSPRYPGRHVVSLATEHKAVRDPLARLAKRGFEVTLLVPRPHDAEDAGRLDVDELANAVRDDTVLVSVMLGNNEIGTLQPLEEIGAICRSRGVLLHTDATQAVGRIDVDVKRLQVDLLSFSAHKIYGPKGVGALYVRRDPPQVRLSPQIDGGGQEMGLRSGTLNVPGIVGMARALKLCVAEQTAESQRLRRLRDQLFEGLRREIRDVRLNGPSLAHPQWRLPHNLNVAFGGVDGESLMLQMPELAVSSGSACTAANPEPSHVLRALGLRDEDVRGSLRFGLGRFNTEAEVEAAIVMVAQAVRRLRGLSEISYH